MCVCVFCVGVRGACVRVRVCVLSHCSFEERSITQDIHTPYLRTGSSARRSWRAVSLLLPPPHLTLTYTAPTPQRKEVSKRVSSDQETQQHQMMVESKTRLLCNHPHANRSDRMRCTGGCDRLLLRIRSDRLLSTQMHGCLHLDTYTYTLPTPHTHTHTGSSVRWS